MTVFYKIRKRDDPESYVKGTPYYMTYDKSGRIFQTMGQLRTFLTNVMNADHNGKSDRNRVADWEIVELEMIERDVKGINDVITAKTLAKLLKR